MHPAPHDSEHGVPNPEPKGTYFIVVSNAPGVVYSDAIHRADDLNLTLKRGGQLDNKTRWLESQILRFLPSTPAFGRPAHAISRCITRSGGA